MEIYELGEFVRKEHRPIISKKKTIAYSVPFVPMGMEGLLKSTFLNKDVMLIGGIGIVALGLIGLEKYLAMKGRDFSSNMVSTFMSVCAPVVAFSVVLYAMYTGIALF